MTLDRRDPPAIRKSQDVSAGSAAHLECARNPKALLVLQGQGSGHTSEGSA